MRKLWNIFKNEKIGYHFIFIEFSFILLIVVSKVSFSEQTYKYILIGIVLLEIISFYNLFQMFSILSEQAVKKAEQNLLIKQTEIQNEYILASMQANKDMNKMRDELLEIIQTKNIDENKDLRTLVNEMIEEYTSSLYMHYSSNQIIDAILYNKSLLMKKLHIHHEIQVIVPQNIGIEDFAIMSVLSNMLDNAIDACSLLPIKERNIQVNIQIRANYLIFQIENAFDTSKFIKLEKGISTKTDRQSHGLGILIIENTCKEHQGHFTFEVNKENKTITCTATLQIQLEENNNE